MNDAKQDIQQDIIERLYLYMEVVDAINPFLGMAAQIGILYGGPVLYNHNTKALCKRAEDGEQVFGDLLELLKLYHEAMVEAEPMVGYARWRFNARYDGPVALMSETEELIQKAEDYRSE